MNKFSLRFVSKYVSDFLHLILPSTCIHCENELPNSEIQICSICESELQYTEFINYKEPTPLDQTFWGRVNLFSTYAYFYFEKEKISQTILHDLKYKHNSKIGKYYGFRIGEQIDKNEMFNGIDALIPVPIHHRKKFNRGFNQAEIIAKGISVALKKPIDNRFIKKKMQTSSQTKKDRASRFENTKETISLNKLRDYKHIAIIDDVITTGATLENIIHVIQEKYPEIRISIICLAFTK